MPALTAIEGLTYADAKEGDIILGSTVTKVRRGRLYVYVTTDRQPTTEYKHEFGEYAPISRMLPTPDEVQAQQRAGQTDALDWLARRAEQARTEVAERMTRDLAVGVPSFSDLEQLPAVTAECGLWLRLDREHLHRVLQYGPDAMRWDAPSRVDVARELAQQTARELVRYASTSGSTSQAQRLLDDANRAGRARWADEVLRTLGE